MMERYPIDLDSIPEGVKAIQLHRVSYWETLSLAKCHSQPYEVPHR